MNEARCTTTLARTGMLSRRLFTPAAAIVVINLSSVNFDEIGERAKEEGERRNLCLELSCWFYPFIQ
jgi:hypothetical protein